MESQTVQASRASGPSVSAKIERGQRGGYGWTLGAHVVCQPGQTHAAAFEAAISALTEADGTMRRLFAGAADLSEAA